MIRVTGIIKLDDMFPSPYGVQGFYIFKTGNKRSENLGFPSPYGVQGFYISENLGGERSSP